MGPQSVVVVRRFHCVCLNLLLFHIASLSDNTIVSFNDTFPVAGEFS